MRKLASIQKILAINPIPGADSIERVSVLGWDVVSQKGIHSVGDLVVYYEIDSWLPDTDPRYASFEARFSNWGDKRGMRLKTVRLLKQISQGLILSLKQFPEIKNPQEGDDVTELLKIEKWESLSETHSNGGGAQGVHTKNAKPFPSFIRKTDQERIQNYLGMIPHFMKDHFEASIKLDGSSMTVFHITNKSPVFEEALDDIERRQLRKATWLNKQLFKFKKILGIYKKPEYIQGVCSRNIQLDVDGDNHFSKYVKDNNILEALGNLGQDIAIQGELVGPSIQDNFEKVSNNEYYVYDVFDLNTQEYLMPNESRDIVSALGINYVPVINANMQLKDIPGVSEVENDPRAVMECILKFAEGEGMNKGVKREGLVFKSNTGPHSFKAISNSYLLKKDK